MSRERVALVRLLICCVAWASGAVVVTVAETRELYPLLPASLFAGAYWLTRDLGAGGGDDGDARYWRGRRISGRWN